jgi:hypothetical protein
MHTTRGVLYALGVAFPEIICADGCAVSVGLFSVVLVLCHVSIVVDGRDLPAENQLTVVFTIHAVVLKFVIVSLDLGPQSAPTRVNIPKISHSILGLTLRTFPGQKWPLSALSAETQLPRAIISLIFIYDLIDFTFFVQFTIRVIMVRHATFAENLI